MNEVSQPVQKPYTQNCGTFLQSILCHNFFQFETKKEYQLTQEPKSSQIKFSVQEHIQKLQNSQVLRLGVNQWEGSLIVKITPKYQSNGFHLFHQTSQINFVTIIIQKSFSPIIKIHNLFSHQNKLITIMDYGCGGDLTKYIKTNSFLMTQEQKKKKVNWVRNIIRQVVDGLQIIHGLGYVYRDLKPSNLLVDHKGKIKICDFGFVIKQGLIDPSFCGTPDYMAPQRISEKKNNSPVQKNVDMWSLGVLTYQLLTGQTPYLYQDNTNELLNEIYNGYISFDAQYPEYVKNFILNLLQPNPKKRLTLQKVKDHKFLNIKQTLPNEKWHSCKCDY